MIRFANLVSRDCYHRINEINNETFPVFLAGFQSRVDLCLCCNLWLSLSSTPGEFKEWFSCFQHPPSAFSFAFFFFFSLTFHIILCFKHKGSLGYFQIKKPNRVNNLQWKKFTLYLEKQPIWHQVRKGVGEGCCLQINTKKSSQFYFPAVFAPAAKSSACGNKFIVLH